MNDAEKVREDRRWLRDCVEEGARYRDTAHALDVYDSILTELAEAQGEVREWLCLKCRTVYPRESVRRGVWCVVCPNEACQGDIGPRNVMEKREAEERAEKAEEQVALLQVHLKGAVRWRDELAARIQTLEAGIREHLTRHGSLGHEGLTAALAEDEA